MWGHYGHGIGAWFIPTSTESYAGGPLRQGTRRPPGRLSSSTTSAADTLRPGGGNAAGTGGKPKIHGPWYIYFNTAATPDALIADAKKISAAEKAKWPYPWVDEPTYPLNPTHRPPARSKFPMTAPLPALTSSSANPPTAAAVDEVDAAAVVAEKCRQLACPHRSAVASIIYNHSGEYIFYVHADSSGHFTLPAVRPGTYSLYAWQTQGPITQSLALDNVEIKGDTQNLGNIGWDAPYHPNLLFQIGNPDRMAGEYNLGTAPRDYYLLNKVPAEVAFTVGKSKEATDWFFAQNGGTWTVNFNVDKLPAGNCYLTLPVAGGGGNNCAVALNGTSIGNITKGDDGSVRRQTNPQPASTLAMPSLLSPASNLKQGANSLTLQGKGMMYDTVVLESD